MKKMATLSTRVGDLEAHVDSLQDGQIALAGASNDTNKRVDAIRRGVDEKTSNIRTRIADGFAATKAGFVFAAGIILLNVIGLSCHIQKAKGWDRYYQDQMERIQSLENTRNEVFAFAVRLNQQIEFLNVHGRRTHSDNANGISYERRESGYLFYIRGDGPKQVGTKTYTPDEYLKFIQNEREKEVEPTRCRQVAPSMYEFYFQGQIWVGPCCNTRCR